MMLPEYVRQMAGWRVRKIRGWLPDKCENAICSAPLVVGVLAVLP
jgi:hypothetical protein